MSLDAPVDLHDAFTRAFNAAGLDALLGLYEPGAVLLAGGQPARGHQQIRAALEGYLSMKGHIALQTLSVTDSGDGLALLHAAWQIRPAGQPDAAPIATGVTAEVARRQPDGTWRYILDNPSVPTAA